MSWIFRWKNAYSKKFPLFVGNRDKYVRPIVVHFISSVCVLRFQPLLHGHWKFHLVSVISKKRRAPSLRVKSSQPTDALCDWVKARTSICTTTKMEHLLGKSRAVYEEDKHTPNCLKISLSFTLLWWLMVQVLGSVHVLILILGLSESRNASAVGGGLIKWVLKSSIFTTEKNKRKTLKGGIETRREEINKEKGHPVLVRLS